jgi:hypothetical protein
LAEDISIKLKTIRNTRNKTCQIYHLQTGKSEK